MGSAWPMASFAMPHPTTVSPLDDLLDSDMPVVSM